MTTYSENLKLRFSQEGFVASPLSNTEINECEAEGLSIDEAYAVGLEVSLGGDFIL